MKLPLPAALALAAALCGCSPSVQAPDDRGVCWTMTKMAATQTSTGKTGVGKLAFNKLTSGVPDIEHCGAALEALRLRFLSLGGNRHDIYGAYQGQFIFVEKEGISISSALTKSPFLILVRTGDGRLAQPGAVRQP